jgi:sugar/nucleoside kinase (ribokinase family)
MKKIIGIGNSLVDYMITIENDSYLERVSLPKGSMNLIDSSKSDAIFTELKPFIAKKIAGGATANTINGLAKLNVDVTFVGKIGKDETGEVFKQDLINNGVKPVMFYSPTNSGKVAALITPDSERTFATYLGASVELSASDLNPDIFKGYDIAYIEGYLVQNHELIETACKYAKNSNCAVCIDLASFNIVQENYDFLNCIIEEYIDIVFANEDEAKAITGADPDEALEILSKKSDIAVVKIGKQGSMIKKDGKKYTVGIRPAKAIDTTGAGDLYASGFLYGFMNDYPIEKCGEIGSIISGKIVEVLGAKLSDDVWIDIKKEIEKV